VIGWGLAERALAVAAIAAFVCLPGSAAAVSSVVLRGFGAATIDGVPATGEWDPAGHVDFTVNRSSSQGGGTVAATLYLMNDAQNLYLGLKVTNATIASSSLEVEFDNDRNGSNLQEGEDQLLVNDAGVFDGFMHQIAPNTWQAVRDQDYGGTNDILEGEANNPGFSFYEVSHPLNDADDAHDLSLAFARRAGFQLTFRHCSPCATTSYFPDRNSFAQLVVVSGSRVPPDTQIASGPRPLVNDPAVDLEFTGSDDIISPGDLTFECKLGEDAWRDCTSPYTTTVDDGRYTFSVRAVDEMLNADLTPAERSWRVDTTGPSKPRVRGPRVAKTPTPVYRFSAKDEGTPARRIRFRCAFDSTRLHRCAARYRQRLRRGRHRLRVAGVDSLGNVGGSTTIRVIVKSPRR